MFLKWWMEIEDEIPREKGLAEKQERVIFPAVPRKFASLANGFNTTEKY